MHMGLIGLIGGIGLAATDFYYRRIIAAFAAKNTEFDLTIVHAGTPTLLRHLLQNEVAAQVAIYTRLSNRLVAAGSDCAPSPPWKPAFIRESPPPKSSPRAVRTTTPSTTPMSSWPQPASSPQL